MLLLLINSLNLGQLSVIHQKIVQRKKYSKNIQMKTLNQVCSCLGVTS